MLLRRITEHIKGQNWAAIGIDFVIVVVGVFIGIQVSNWNERLSFEMREKSLMRELRGEIDQNIADVQAKGEMFLVGATSARRVLHAIDGGTVPCADGCWSIVVDLMHASQWQQLFSSWPIYDELRREGLPRDRRVIELVEKFKNYSHQSGAVLMTPPQYRTVVRRLVPIDVQDAYWAHCFNIVEAVEHYLSPCPVSDDFSIDPAKVGEILAHAEIAPTLREWTSIARVVGTTLVEPQIALGKDILRQIDGEAEK